MPAKGPWTLVEQGLQLLASKMACGVRWGADDPRCKVASPRVEGMDGIADGLIVATQLRGNPLGPLPTGTGQQDPAVP
jgi:hypothetical protein